MPNFPKRILLVTADLPFVAAFARTLHDYTSADARSDFNVSWLENGEQAQKHLGLIKPHVVVVTTKLKGSMPGQRFVGAIEPERRQLMAVVGVYGLAPDDQNIWDGAALDGRLPAGNSSDFPALVSAVLSFGIQMSTRE
ncbi:MAG: hypothetical protein HY420_04075 [Candidatus Kerfeldbacteria bacterium]|nr:hypothetical protein [Candidatus Kerfeldbacteria bacterium]